MGPLFETVDDLVRGTEILRRRRYGVIEAAGGQLTRVRLRPWPKIATVPGIVFVGGWHHRHKAGDWCLGYYNQPRSFPSFLVLKYVVSGRGGTLASLYRVLETLDEIARLKGSDALLCDVANWRVSEALMARWGWEPHCPSRWHRHYIKRFYGNYPKRPDWIERLYAGV